MAYEFRLPDIGEGVAEGEVVQWFVHEGDMIQEDAPLVSVLTDKANVEIPSPKRGRISKIHAAVGEKVKVGGLLVTIEPAGGSASSEPTPAGSAVAPAAMPPRVAGAVAPAATSRPTEVAPPAPSSTGVVPSSRIAASPYLRRLASERGIDLSKVRGSGPGGRVTEADLAAPTPSPSPPAHAPTGSLDAPPVPPAPAAATDAPVAEPPPAATTEVAERIPIRGLRRVIAEHMVEATHRPAPFTYVEEVNVSELVLLRDRLAKHVEKDGIRLSYLPFIVKGVVAGLKAHPRMNATMDDARNELVLRSAYHIGIATATKDGLIVPVIRHADRKSLSELAREIQDLAERGRAGKLKREELTDSTFTITSLG
ncbi:MAG: dihydrolipoamide acetyltransferase family protein, partial [Thermoplasmata archaeon]